MSDVTQILSRIESGDPTASEQLLPLVYDELRRLATHRLSQEKPGQTLQATALVHEAYVRLVDGKQAHNWNGRGHFFAAAAESMRRILVEKARQKQTQKYGGDWIRHQSPPEELLLSSAGDPLELLAVHETLDRLADRSPRIAELVKLRYFVGCTLPEAAEILGISSSTAEDDWTYARAWLRREWLRGEGPNS